MNDIVDDFLDSYDKPEATQEVIISKPKNIEVLTEDKVLVHVTAVVNTLMEDLQKTRDTGKALAIARTLTEVKKAWWPATNKNVNTNINVIDSTLKAWREENKELIKMEEERIRNLKNERTIESR